MKGDKGICSLNSGSNLVRRTKFDTQENAQAACDFHNGTISVNSNYIVYQCKECGMWHFGKPEWAEKYGKH